MLCFSDCGKVGVACASTFRNPSQTIQPKCRPTTQRDGTDSGKIGGENGNQFPLLSKHRSRDTLAVSRSISTATQIAELRMVGTPSRALLRLWNPSVLLSTKSTKSTATKNAGWVICSRIRRCSLVRYFEASVGLSFLLLSKSRPSSHTAASRMSSSSTAFCRSSYTLRPSRTYASIYP